MSNPQPDDGAMMTLRVPKVDDETETDTPLERVRCDVCFQELTPTQVSEGHQTSDGIVCAPCCKRLIDRSREDRLKRSGGDT